MKSILIYIFVYTATIVADIYFQLFIYDNDNDDLIIFHIRRTKLHNLFIAINFLL